MAVKITENPALSHKLRHFKITVDSEDKTHTISTTVTSHPGVARDWIHYTLHLHRHHRRQLIVGLGVQWTPFHYYYYDHPAATIQLCVGSRCLIFQLHHSDSSPRILRRILSDPKITFVGLWNHSDTTKLRQCPGHELSMCERMPVDMRLHVFGRGGRMMVMKRIEEIAEEVLGVEMGWWDEDVSRSDWELEELSWSQVMQASVDAFVGFAVGLKFAAWELKEFS